jgi:rsbT antagonist protein RsbS
MKIPVPLLKIGSILLVPIEIELTDEMAEELHISILRKVEETGVKGLVLDVSLTEIIDSYFARILINVGRAATCLNCQTVVVGVTPEVAITLTQMGVTWRGVKTALNVEEAIVMVERDE